jgi:opacity protein-like surface antigen
MNRISRTKKCVLLGGSALVLVLSGSSGAMAQNCTSTSLRPGFLQLGGLAAATASSIAGSVGNESTVFLTQQGSAFVANPAAPPNTQGGGIWVRGVGGEVDVKSTSATIANQTPVLNPAIDSGSIACASKVHENFAGVQVGTDIAKLNVNGWNINLGTTAGYLESHANERNTTAGIPGPPRMNFEVPFIGTYLVATSGGFFADLMVRGEFYNMSLNNPGADFFSQQVSAHGASVSASAGYNYSMTNNWFIEPSLGFTWSRTKVDAFNAVGLPEPQLGAELSGTFKISDIDSEIGRATVRVGTSFTSGYLALQPFVSASVFHEFASNILSNYLTCPNCVFVGATPVQASFLTTTSRIGTYGQFSLGLAGQVQNTGWVGFVRGDYRTGDNINGWTANAGLRYNFLPAAPPLITKGPAVPPAVTAMNWTGLYAGGWFGAGFGSSRMQFLGDGWVTPRIAGPVGGGQVGYNWQLGPYIAGLEGDVGAANIHGARTCGGNTGVNAVGLVTAFSPFFLNCENDLQWTASFGGRLGFAWDRTLFYIKAGGAWTSEKLTVGCIIGPNNGLPGNARACLNQVAVLTNGSTASDDRFGLMAGWGTEFALTGNWTAKAEYVYMAFGNDTVRTTDGTLLKVNTNVSEVKVGVNYYFNAAAPVVTRY